MARAYRGNNRKRRIAKRSDFSAEQLARIAKQGRYGGSALHKSKPADYGLDPPVNPRPPHGWRPAKSLCDGLRVVGAAEARGLLLAGIRRGMVSTCRVGGLPKYVWAQDAQGEVYEAKLGGDMRSYHGYRLGDDEGAMKKWVTEEWAKRQV